VRGRSIFGSRSEEGFGLIGGFGGGGAGEVRGVYLLTMACYLLLYFFGWTKGRAVLPAGVLIFFASWVAFEVGGTGSGNVVPFQGEISSSSSSTTTSFSSDRDTTDSSAAAALIVDLVFLGAGAATPFVARGVRGVRGRHRGHRA